MKIMIAGIIILMLPGCAAVLSGLTGQPTKASRLEYVRTHDLRGNVTAEMLTEAGLSQTEAEMLTGSPYNRIGQAIIAGRIAKGMTKEEVEASWGSPCLYCYGTTHNSYGDTWEYNLFGTGSAGAGSGTYVFFDGSGRVSGWSQ